MCNFDPYMNSFYLPCKSWIQWTMAQGLNSKKNLENLTTPCNYTNCTLSMVRNFHFSIKSQFSFTERFSSKLPRTWPSQIFQIDGFCTSVGQLSGYTSVHALGTWGTILMLRCLSIKTISTDAQYVTPDT